ncbi:MAG: aminotransferase class V-fold PLP-dependent enzyme [Planctomycetota bacterium]|nr:aminotransferase class V-fold PLP-dependent enzyme [Planctomycetota bacterium]
MDTVYLDNNATTRLAPEALEAMLPYLGEWYGNASSAHRFGQRSRQAIEEARAQLAGLIGCGDQELILTGGGTEAVNTAIRGVLGSRGSRRKIVTSVVEHSATRELCRELSMSGVEVVEIGVEGSGALDMEGFGAAVDDSVALVTMMWANNETGVIFPVEQIAAVCRQRGVPFHCDGTQAVGKVAVDVRGVGMDLMSLAAHKFHGPKGVGALYVRRGVRMRPLIIGGPQERGRRGGTENVAGMVGMGKAAELAGRLLGEMGRVAELRDELEGGILKRIEDAHVNGGRENRLVNTTNISFARLEAEAILLLLSERGICASAGAACSSGSLEPSHVLRAMRIDERIAHGAVRFSLSRYTTREEVGRALEVLPGVIERLRGVLPVG